MSRLPHLVLATLLLAPLAQAATPPVNAIPWLGAWTDSGSVSFFNEGEVYSAAWLDGVSGFVLSTPGVARGLGTPVTVSIELLTSLGTLPVWSRDVDAWETFPMAVAASFPQTFGVYGVRLTSSPHQFWTYDGFTEADAFTLLGGYGTGALSPGVGPQSVSRIIPGVSTPSVPPQAVGTPPVGTPATCSAAPCTTSTNVPSATVTTPPVPPLGATTPPVSIPTTCVPFVVCAGPYYVPPQTVGPTPGVGPQTVSTPPQTVSPLCATPLGALCLPPTQLVPAQNVVTPGVGSVGLTPPVVVTVATSPVWTWADPRAAELVPYGPDTVEVPTPFGPFPVTLCPSSCLLPVAPQGGLYVDVTVSVSAGAQSFSRTVPISIWI